MTEQMILAGRYRLESLLGRGGMGEVWRAVDERLGRPVAVKLLAVPPDGRAAATAAARFHREARIAARLRHPGIAVVHDFGEDGGRLFLVMELVDGRDLNAVIADHPGGLPPERAAALAARIAAALEAAHEQGVVHRDIKPANVMVDARDEITVLDFGIARYADAVTDLTGGAVIGTPAFMAPEQFDKDAAIDGRTDLYALGALLYVLLTGETPFAADSMPSLLREVMFGPPPSPRERSPDVPADLDTLVRDLLAKDPADRPADAAEVIARLTGRQAGPHRRAPQPVVLYGEPPRTASLTQPPTTGTPDDDSATPAPPKHGGRARRVFGTLMIGVIAFLMVGSYNPGGLFVDEGAFDRPPTCASMTPSELSKFEVQAAGKDSWISCMWTSMDRDDYWSITLNAVCVPRIFYTSAPDRASEALAQNRQDAGPKARPVAIGDGGYVHDPTDKDRIVRFRVSNLMVTLKIHVGRAENKAEPHGAADGLAGQVAKKLEPMA